VIVDMVEHIGQIASGSRGFRTGVNCLAALVQESRWHRAVDADIDTLASFNFPEITAASRF